MTTISWICASAGCPAHELVRPNYIVESFTGMGGSPVDLYSVSAPFQHGSTLVNMRQAPREINLTVWCRANDINGMWLRRRELIAAFNPRAGVGRLRVQRPDAVAFDIFAFPDEAPIFAPTNNPFVFKAGISLVAPYPNWFDPLEETDSFSAAPDSLVAANDGDINTPISIEFDGPVANPSITHDSLGFSISVAKTLVTGEKITIQTGPGAPSAIREFESEVTDAMQFVFETSDLGFYLQPGENTVNFEADSGSGIARLNWKHYYVGI